MKSTVRTFMLVVVSVLFSAQAFAFSVSGDYIFNQDDFRQNEILLTNAPLTGGTTGSNLSLSSVGGNYTSVSYPGSSNTFTWSILIDKTAASSLAAGTNANTSYTGWFSYKDSAGMNNVIGAGTVQGLVNGNTITLATVNGRLGVNGVNPSNTSADDWNTAKFNWTMTFNKSDIQQFLAN